MSILRWAVIATGGLGVAAVMVSLTTQPNTTAAPKIKPAPVATKAEVKDHPRALVESATRTVPPPTQAEIEESRRRLSEYAKRARRDLKIEHANRIMIERAKEELDRMADIIIADDAAR